MAEFLVTGSLVVYLIALLYGAYRIVLSGGTGRSVAGAHRRFSMISRSAPQANGAQDLSYYF